MEPPPGTFATSRSVARHFRTRLVPIWRAGQSKSREHVGTDGHRQGLPPASRRRDLSATRDGVRKRRRDLPAHTSQIRQKPIDALGPADVDASPSARFWESSTSSASLLFVGAQAVGHPDVREISPARGSLEDDPSSLVAAQKPQTIPAHLTIDEMSSCSRCRRLESARPPRPRDSELFYASGLRLSELVGLGIEDVNLRADGSVLGKGGRTARSVQHVDW